MRARVRFRLPDGSVRDLGPGDHVGRGWSAALVLDDPRVSEAHGMVSLRGDQLLLLGLRGRFRVNGAPCTEVALRPGQQVFVTRDLALEVVEVDLPDEVLAVEAEGLGRRVLHGTCGLMLHPLDLVSPPPPGAVAWLWNTAGRWRIRSADGEVRPLVPGDEVAVGSVTLRAVAVPLRTAAGHATHVEGAVATPLRIVAQYDTVHVYRVGDAVVTIDGLGARMVSELVAFEGPVPWEVLAGQLWPDEPERAALRKRFDVTLARLRRRLRQARIRADLVRTNGSGCYELLLEEGDVVEDRT